MNNKPPLSVEVDVSGGIFDSRFNGYFTTHGLIRVDNYFCILDLKVKDSLFSGLPIYWHNN
jgi:hypothetical protein